MDATDVPPADTAAEDAPTIGRKGVRRPRVEVITRGERRRSWTPDQKREIAAESLNPEMTPTEVARKHGISSGLLYTWRQQLLGGQVARQVRAIPSFAQVDTAAAPDAVPADQPAAQALAVVPSHPEGRIEIVLPGGVVLRVDAQVDGRALRRVLGALEGR